MRKLLLLLGILIATPAFATDTAKVEVRASINDGTATVEDSGLVTKTFTAGVRQQQTLSLSAGANTISVPANSKGVMFDVGSVRSLHLKGVTGDRGLSLDSACPVVLPLSYDTAGVSTNTMIISNDNASAQQILAYWF